MLADLVVARLAERTQEPCLRSGSSAGFTRDASGNDDRAAGRRLSVVAAEREAGAPGTLKIASGGLRFFNQQTFRRQFSSTPLQSSVRRNCDQEREQL